MIFFLVMSFLRDSPTANVYLFRDNTSSQAPSESFAETVKASPPTEP